MNKKGFEMSISMIIILIIAIVTLVLAIGFIKGVFDTLSEDVKNFPTLEVEPTVNDPISFIPSVVTRGKDNRMTIGFYNNEQSDIEVGVTPKINCEGIAAVKLTAAGMNIPVGSWKKYSALVSVPKNTPAGQYSCTISVRNTDNSFFMKVE